MIRLPLASRLRSPIARATAWSLVVGLTAALVLSHSEAALAGGAKAFRQTTAKDFEEGEAMGSMVLPTGEVVPGMKAIQISVDASFIWCSALSPDGRTAYFGGGDQGRIFALSATGSDKATAGDKPAARKLAELAAPWVTSLTVRKDGSLLAGTTPGGQVFVVDPNTGASRSFTKLAAEHVWAMVQDPKTGTTYAATGGSGKVFSIDGQGASRVLWDSGDKHVVALAPGPGGTLLAGTSEAAILYRLRGSEAEALHDFDADEIRAILRVEARPATATAPAQPAATYLAVNDFEKPTDAQASTPAAATASKGTKVALTAGGPAPASAGALPRPGQVKARAGVYRLEDDGNIEQVFSLADGYLTALVLDAGGDLYAASGTQGKVYRLNADRTAALAVDLPERQALALLRVGAEFLIGTGDVGGVYRARPAGTGEATYLSKVLDAEMPTRFGHLRFTGVGVAFETRSGHTAKPDKTWNAWRKLEAPTASAGEGEGSIASPSARYLQYRTTLTGSDAVLKEVVVHHQPHNQRPRLVEVYAEGPASPPVVARTHAAVLKLRWRVENPDGDDLIYRLWYRQESERVWRPLGPTGPVDLLTKAEYDWNTEAVPDGKYLVRVWASDERSTPRERALESTFTSPPLLVDNSKPEILDLRMTNGALTGRARDDASPIAHLEYAVDGLEWRPIGSTDGVLDQRAEAFSVRLPPGLAKGPHVVNLRAFDAADNQGVGRVQIEVK